MIVRTLSVAAFVFGLAILGATFLPWATYELRASELPEEIASQLPTHTWTAMLRGWGSSLRGTFVGLCAAAGALLCLFALYGPRHSSRPIGVRPVLYAACFFALALWMTVTAHSMDKLGARTVKEGLVITTYLSEHHIGIWLTMVGAAVALGLSLVAAWLAWGKQVMVPQPMRNRGSN